MTCATFFPKSLQARKRPPPPCHLSFFFFFFLFFFFFWSNKSKWCDLRVQHNILDHISIEFRSLIVLEFKGGLKRQVLYCSGASVNYLTVDSWCTCRKEHLQESQSKWRSVCFCVCVCVCVLFFCCFFFAEIVIEIESAHHCVRRGTSRQRRRCLQKTELLMYECLVRELYNFVHSTKRCSCTSSLIACVWLMLLTCLCFPSWLSTGMARWSCKGPEKSSRPRKPHTPGGNHRVQDLCPGARDEVPH